MNILIWQKSKLGLGLREVKQIGQDHTASKRHNWVPKLDFDVTTDFALNQ